MTKPGAHDKVTNKSSNSRASLSPRDRLVSELMVRAATYGGSEDSPPREVLGMLGDKWSPLILLILRCGTFRTAELNRLITSFPGSGAISQRMLTLKLRGLERIGLVSREVLPEVPPRVNYSLTATGSRFMEVLMPVYDFLDAHAAELCRAVETFDLQRLPHDDE